MKNLSALVLALVASCGYSSTNSESVGQVKRVVNQTPLICPNYTEVDFSLGVMRNGVGSMSKEDITLAVDNSEAATIAQLKKAAEDGDILKVTYDVKRVSWCWPDHRLLTVAIEATPGGAK